MGKTISDIGSDIESVARVVGQLVTDVFSAVEQLTKMAAGFAPATADSYTVSLADANDIDQALKNAMTGAKTAAETLFTKTWPSVTTAGSDDGVIQGYVSGGPMTCAVEQLTQDFPNWEIDTDATTIQSMVNTIASQIQAQMGAAGTAQGHHSLNMNQQIDWTIAYGLFVINNDTNGLVYAYTAALSGGF